MVRYILILIWVAVGSYFSGYAVAGAGWVTPEDITLLKRALAGVIRKVKDLDFRVRDLEKRVEDLEARIAREVSPKSPKKGKKCVVTASWLRIRTGPGTKYDVVGYLRKGRVKTMLKTQDGWVRVEEGWVSGKFCKEVVE